MDDRSVGAGLVAAVVALVLGTLFLPLALYPTPLVVLYRSKTHAVLTIALAVAAYYGASRFHRWRS